MLIADAYWNDGEEKEVNEEDQEEDDDGRLQRTTIVTRTTNSADNLLLPHEYELKRKKTTFSKPKDVKNFSHHKPSCRGKAQIRMIQTPI